MKMKADSSSDPFNISHKPFKVHSSFCRCYCYLHQLLVFFIALFFFLCSCCCSQASAAGVSSSSSSGDGLNKDWQQLLSFKSSLPSSTQLQLQDWLPSSSPCNFTGVSCKNNRVSSVDLSGISLSVDFGLISSSLAAIQSLEFLVLKRTNLSGSQCDQADRNAR